MATDAPQAGAPAGGSLAPLRQPVFAVLWGATVLGNVGSFMRDVASAWMATELSSSPAAVAMVQAAATLPVFVLAMPAGVLSDILDRRRLLIVLQLVLACISASLLLLAHSQQLSITSLVLLTAAGGSAAALIAPTWQSVVPDLVPRAQLRSAVALSSLGINIARAVGPAAGGALLAAFGAAAAYGADLLSYAVVLAALLWWRPPAPAEDGLLPERFAGAFRAGLRYARASPTLRTVLLRAVVFFACASAVWALLPLVARQLLHGSAGFYGLLLGAVGAGAIGGALLLPGLRRHLDADGLMLGAALLAAVVMAGLALAPPQPAALGLMLLLGAAWITALTTLNGVAQAVLPAWVRGRGLAIYLMAFNGAMTAGSLAWGGVAQTLGVGPALLAGAVALACSALAFHRLRLPSGEADLQPSNHWPEPLLSQPVDGDRGPVMVQIDYQVADADRPQFLLAMRQVAAQRRRDGAYAWGLTEHSAEPQRLMEWFLVASWAEHLRQHRRVSRADADQQALAQRWHQGDQPPRVQHYLSVPLPPAL